MAKYAQEQGVYHAGLLPAPYAFVTDLPFVLLHVPPQTPVLQRDRMELPTSAQPWGWHKHQAAAVHGLSGRLWSRASPCPRVHLPNLGIPFRGSGMGHSLRYPLSPGLLLSWPPFKTRLKNGKGLCIPRTADASMFPNFMCEACQVHATLDREC
jgi:hypothetical protein